MKDVIDLSQFDVKEFQFIMVNGKLNGILIFVIVCVFYFNDEMWKKVGIDYLKIWDELMVVGKIFESKFGKQYYFVILEQQDMLVLLNFYMVQKYNIFVVDEKIKKFIYSKV